MPKWHYGPPDGVKVVCVLHHCGGYEVCHLNIKEEHLTLSQWHLIPYERDLTEGHCKLKP